MLKVPLKVYMRKRNAKAPCGLVAPQAVEHGGFGERGEGSLHLSRMLLTLATYGGVQVVSDTTASDPERAQELDDIDQRGLACGATTINYWRRETYDKALLWLERCKKDKPDTAQLIYLPSSTASAVAPAVIDPQAARLTIMILLPR